MKDKLSKLERDWILYDVGNSAFILLVTTIIPIVFNNLAKGHLDDDTYLAYWGYAVTASTLIVGLMGPILGSLSDLPKQRKRMFTIALIIGVIGCTALPFAQHWLAYLLLFVVTKSAYNASLIFYDSMLNDVTTAERMDRVSSHGYAWGYIGSVVPFLIAIVLIFGGPEIGLSSQISIILAFLVNAIWWGIMSLPLLKSYQQISSHKSTPKIGQVFKDLVLTFKEIKQNRQIFLYLIAFFFFIDGVYTIINLATAYGTSLGLDTMGLVLALLVTQIVAFPFALLFARFSKGFKTETLIKVCILAYTGIAIYGVQLDQLHEFWILAVAVGMFQGAIQALSRSYYAKIIPSYKSGEYFGIFDICGKGASFVGTLLVSVITQMTGNQQIAVFSLSFMFLLGYYFFHLTIKSKEIA
ncbi:MFS transporter [Eremococcus coleocola]|uniref:MFS transporter n=1 Tax=Eremococcus coleocola TaxID=88132 RepID=UPI0003F7A7DF|nr:MFS transporter [Eremococcus coleocola]